MNIATLLFTYNRSYHTELVLTALMENAVRPQKLYIFQDGLNQGSGEEKEWERVNHIIHTVDWCDTEVIVSDCNRGLAEAIVSGINYAFKDNDAVIVLEDDCVPAKNFLGYMYI